MASSGSFNTSAYNASDGSRYLVFSWTVTTQSIANNTTTISWSLKGGGTSKQYIYAGNFKVVIAGETVYSYTGSRIKLYNGTTVASGSYTFKHDDNGAKSFAASAEGGIYNHAVNCTGSKTFTLDTIERASQPSCITWPEHTQNVGEFGDTISIHMNRQSSAFTHTVRYAFGSKSGTIAKDVATGTTWKIPLSLMDLIPSSTSGSGTIYVDTYNGSTLIGTKYCGFTATVPASVKPTASFTLEDISGVGDIYGSPVKGLSKIKITVNAQQAYSSPIASGAISANGSNYSGLTATTGLLKSSGKSTVTATVKDKRGRTGTVSYDMNVLDYSAPAVTALTAKRCDEDGTLNKRGAYIKVTFSAAVSSMSSKNTAVYKLKYKQSSASSYTAVTLSALTNTYTVAEHEHIFAASTGRSYEIVIEVTDRHNSAKPASKSTKAQTAHSVFSWRGFKTENGVEDGAGIGKVPERPNVLEIAWETIFYGKVSGTIFDAVYPVGSIYLAYNHTNPGTLFPGTTWARIENAFPWFTGATGTIGQTGGERTHTLTASELPAHSHRIRWTDTDGNAGGTAKENPLIRYGTTGTGYDGITTLETGEGAAHNNMPPYIQISAWRRTA